MKSISFNYFWSRQWGNILNTPISNDWKHSDRNAIWPVTKDTPVKVNSTWSERHGGQGPIWRLFGFGQGRREPEEEVVVEEVQLWVEEEERWPGGGSRSGGGRERARGGLRPQFTSLNRLSPRPSAAASCCLLPQQQQQLWYHPDSKYKTREIPEEDSTSNFVIVE